MDSLRPAIFFDRDGTLAEEVEYAHRAEHFHIYPFAADAVRQVNRAGWAAIVVTNQAGVARGLYDERAVGELHALLERHMAACGAHLDGIYYCPHHPDFGAVRDCACRKPRPGMLLQAAREHGLDLGRSWVIGDRESDIGLAHNARARGALVRTGYGLRTEAGLEPVHAGGARPRRRRGACEPDLIAENVAEAVQRILADVSASAKDAAAGHGGGKRDRLPGRRTQSLRTRTA